MKSRMRMQYYCDHCKKNGASRYHMERHEKACTANPDRVCGVCGQRGVDKIVKEFLVGIDSIKFLTNGEYQHEILSKFRELTDGCPACMLAAYRQTPDTVFSFDYQEEHKSYWKKRNEEERDC